MLGFTRDPRFALAVWSVTVAAVAVAVYELLRDC